MKDAIRCCISCILPCGALDVIRIVHSNGHVEEISGTIRAAEIMKLHPKHVLKKPSYAAEGVCHKISIVPPDSELQRGKIYFLMPMPMPPPPERTRSRSSTRRRTKERGGHGSSDTASLLCSDRYLSEILTEKVSLQTGRRRGRVGIWRPHLESICEAP